VQNKHKMLKVQKGTATCWEITIKAKAILGFYENAYKGNFFFSCRNK
jgi:hypothetical protein